jgi:UDP-glucose 4-epimerase
MAKILVTGGCGYIGSHTIIDLLDHGFDVLSVDNLVNSDEKVLAGIEKITGRKVNNAIFDLCDREKTRSFFDQHQDIDGIIHFAALKSVGESVEKPLLYFRNNLTSLVNILEMMTIYGIKSFVFSSSCSVYGNADVLPVTEKTPVKEAASPYARTKQIGEQIILDALKSIPLESVLLRYFNPAGAHPTAIIGESPINPASNLVPVITETAIGKREKMIVFGDDYDTRDGTCIRDYIYIMDLSKAHTLALNRMLENRMKHSFEVFNLGMGEGVTVMEAINAFEKVTGLKLNYEIGSRRPGDVVAIYADYTKAREELGWIPKAGIEEIMQSAWNWEKERSNFNF